MLLVFIIATIIYIVAGVMIYHNLYNYDKSSKIKLMIIGFIITFIATVIICFVSFNGINIEGKDVGIVKSVPVFIFAPINAIICLPYIGNLLNKYKDKRINNIQLQKRIIVFFAILVCVIIFEIAYIRDFEMGLANIIDRRDLLKEGEIDKGFAYYSREV